ncbi:ANTAR domain-containing protein [Amycolatopsis sp. OK19-0408]|uniref:ANTAR domain-containing protein n=1 Tax=Amycolatopsis iheyensis TaxID=2945988 RepID=A0A9X2NJ97_9PSEU|nr:ANTAR domain-containing protein [Amycolatopsis iheyensis]MCR6489779.1 ANTAR domain-containing protein [Amycolatopsis iheyensis]
MARQGIGAGEAFALLRGTSQDLNVKPATSLAASHIDIEGR